MSNPPSSASPGRDFAGYFNQPPAVRWPGGARVAVSFVVNFEEGGEFSVADGDACNEAVHEVIDARSGVDLCVDSHFEYGTRAGYWRIAELFAAHGCAFTLSSCGRAVERSPWLAAHAAAAGHEVSAHGWRWERNADLDEDAERSAIRRTCEAIAQATGKRPVGWHTRSNPSPRTRRLLQEAGFLYDSDAYNDDVPYFVPIDGARHLVLPYAFDTNDMQFHSTQRFGTGDEFARYVCSAFDWLRAEGATRPRMLSVGLHLRIVGRPARMAALQAILRHVRASGEAWVATREQIARHWIAHAPQEP